MQRVTRATNVADKPALPAAEGPGGFFTKGDPAIGLQATQPGYEWCNRVQEELVNIIHASGMSLDGADDTQVNQAIQFMIDASVVLGATDLQKRRIAWNTMQMLLSTSKSSGAWVNGQLWELLTDEWGATSTNETYDATDNFYTNAGPQTIYTPAAAIGDMIDAGGVGAAFDGVTAYTTATSAVLLGGAAAAHIGQDLGLGGAKTVTGIKLWSSTNAGFSNVNGAAITFSLLGSNINDPATATNLGSGSIVDSSSSQVIFEKLSGFVTTTPYRYIWVKMSGASGNPWSCSECVFYTTDVPADMTLVSPNIPAPDIQPVEQTMIFLWKDVSGTAVLGTDLTVTLSNDNNVTKEVATLTDLGDFDGTYRWIEAVASSAMGTGTTPIIEIKTLNGKEQRIKPHVWGWTD